MYKIIVASDDIHEKVFVEMYYHDKYVALLNQEKGIDEIEIEFPGCINLDQQLILRTIPLKEFINLVNEAKLKLVESVP